VSAITSEPDTWSAATMSDLVSRLDRALNPRTVAVVGDK
jgi:hypothetical protein